MFFTFGSFLIGAAALFGGFVARDTMLKNDAHVLEIQSGRLSSSIVWPDRKQEVLRILVLDGGGVRGLVQLQALKYLEDITGKNISDLFDGVIATSVGCSVATMLLITDKAGKPVYTVDDVIAMMSKKKNISKIFNQSYVRWFSTMNGLFGPKYSGKSKADFLHGVLGDVQYNRLKKPMIMTSWSPENVRPLYLNNWDETYARWPVWALLQGVTSPPAYFPPTRVVDASIPNKKHLDLSDGGVFLNSPSSPVLIKNMMDKMNVPFKHILVVNIGTGFSDDHFGYDQIGKWGAAAWFSPLFASMGTLMKEAQHDELKGIEAQDHDKFKILFLNVPLPLNTMDLDNISQENIRKLYAAGKKLVDIHRDQLEKIAYILQKPESGVWFS